MSTKYKFKDPDKLYFVSFAVVYWIDRWVRNEYKDILLDSWKYCQANKGLELFAWCIMTSHVHMIIGPHGDKLENIMRDVKRHTSSALKKAIQTHPAESRREGLLWLMGRAGKKNSIMLIFSCGVSCGVAPLYTLWSPHPRPLSITCRGVPLRMFSYWLLLGVCWLP